MTDRPPNRGLLFTPKLPNHIPYQRSEEVSMIIAEGEIFKAQHLIPLSPKPPPTSNSWIWGTLQLSQRNPRTHLTNAPPVFIALAFTGLIIAIAFSLR